MEISLPEFESYFSGGLTPARREEIWLAILTDSKCMQIASTVFLQDELKSLSAVEEKEEEEEEEEKPGLSIGTFLKAAFSFFAAPLFVEMFEPTVLEHQLDCVRKTRAAVNIKNHNRDAELVKQVLENCSKDGVFVHKSMDNEAFSAIMHEVEPVIEFWSNYIDKGYFARGTARSIALELLSKPNMNLFVNYDAEKGGFATYFDKAFRRELISALKEMQIKISGRTSRSVEDTPQAVDGQGPVEVMIHKELKKIVNTEIEKLFPAEEWALFALRFKEGKTLEEIAALHKCSMSRISRRTSATMEKVRKYIRNMGYDCCAKKSTSQRPE